MEEVALLTMRAIPDAESAISVTEPLVVICWFRRGVTEAKVSSEHAAVSLLAAFPMGQATVPDGLVEGEDVLSGIGRLAEGGTAT